MCQPEVYEYWRVTFVVAMKQKNIKILTRDLTTSENPAPVLKKKKKIANISIARLAESNPT